MKKDIAYGLKFILTGIAFILFGIFLIIPVGNADAGYWAAVGVASPFIGLALVVIGCFAKDKKNTDEDEDN